MRKRSKRYKNLLESLKKKEYKNDMKKFFENEFDLNGVKWVKLKFSYFSIFVFDPKQHLSLSFYFYFHLWLQ